MTTINKLIDITALLINLRLIRLTFLFLSLLALTPFATAQISEIPVSETLAPELASALQQVSTATGRKQMVVTANKHASHAAFNILERGGTAIDAAVAAQLSLGLVEPQSSGIGGGAFLLYWDNKSKRLTYYDGRETAPAALSEQHFIHPPEQIMNFFDAVIGGHSVGVPGVLRMLELAQQQHGKLDWKDLFDDTIQLAQQGFNLSPRLHQLLSNTNKHAPIATNPEIKTYLFNPDGTPLPAGYLLKNPKYAAALTLIATQGADAFYQGDIAHHIIARLQQDPLHKSLMTLDDLKNYQAKIRQPICAPYQQFTVCGAAPPSSGGTTVLSILGILNHLNLSTAEVDSPEFIHLFAEASKLAFADRNQYIGDPDFLNYSAQGLVNSKYLSHRAALIKLNTASTAMPGLPPGLEKISSTLTDSGSPELPSTSHFSIIDQWGNAVSMTTSIETAFGSRVMVDGFILNNQLTDFSFRPTKNNKQVANSAAGNKRPRSSMSPTMVFNKDKSLKMIVGSPGGSRIIDYTAQTIIYHLTKNLSLADAVQAPHIVHNNGRYLELEEDYFTQATIEALKSKGHNIKRNAQTSGIHAISIDKGIISGAADPRREGLTLGY